jgi:hypothetical protein
MVKLYRKLEIACDATAATVRAQLASLIATKFWTGSVWDDCFELRREIGFMHAPSLPLATGKIVQNDGRPLLRVTIRLPVAVWIFGAVWMLPACGAALFSIVAAIRLASPRPLVVWIMPIFGAAFFTLGFDDEAKKLEAAIRQAAGVAKGVR